MNVVNEVKSELGDEFDCIEYKFTIKANILRCVKMGVKNLPSLYINGKLVWSSLIPSKQELVKKIREQV